MTRTTMAEFARLVGEFQEKARLEPVEITRAGERELVLMSAAHYDWLTATAKRSFRTVEAVQVVTEAVRRSEMGDEQSNLDELLK